jgi:4-hydroxy-2-oxoheptanedioate aldolase
MRPNKTLRLLHADQPAFGAWAMLRDPAVVEIIGLAGYDFALADLEHLTLDQMLIEDMARAADAVGVDLLVRTSENNEKEILRLLDAGVSGILVPHVKTRQEAEAAVRATKYRPIGQRTIPAGTRAQRYHAVPLAQHMRESNDEVLLALLIEDAEAIPVIEDIVAVPGVDVAFVGPADLARSLGHIEHPNHPDILAACDRIIAAARQHKVALGFTPEHPWYSPTLEQLLERGGRLFTTAMDITVLTGAFQKDVQDLRQRSRNYRA